MDLATETDDDPHADLRTAFEHEGLAVRLMDGVWVVDDVRRNPRRQAARVATLAGARCAVLARASSRAAVMLRDGLTLAVAESTAPRWRIYRLSPIGTPLSLPGGDDGMPPPVANHPLQPVPDEVQRIAELVGVNPALLVVSLQTSP